MSLSRDRGLRRSLSAVSAAIASVAAIAVLIVVAPGPAGAASSGNAQLTLLSQSQWVTPPQPGGPATFTLGLSASGAPPGSRVVATLYSKLITRSSFEAVLKDSPGQVRTVSFVDRTAAIPLQPGSGGGVTLHITVVPPSAAAGTTPSPSLDLSCPSGTCTGVYPVVVALESPSGSDLDHFTTFLTYATRSTDKLRFAWVVPLASRTSIRSNTSDPARGLSPIGASTASHLERLVTTLQRSDVPVTLEPAAQTVQALTESGPKGKRAVTTLKTLSANPSVDQVVANGYVPIDLGALAAAGEPTEITAQLQAGTTVLAHLGVKSAGDTTWIATGQVGTSLGNGLTQAGVTHVVVPDDQLASATITSTWAYTFQLPFGGNGPTPTAATSDGVLESEFTSRSAGPALAATRMLADLAMVHSEDPFTGQRGLVAVPPAGWRPTHIFDATLLTGLRDSPVVQPVTLSRFFATVKPAQHEPTRRLASASGPSLSRSLAHQISTARLRLTAFDGAVTKRTPVPAQLAQALLAAEAAYRNQRGMAAQVSAFDHLLGSQVSQVRVSSTDNSITLTAHTGWIPITVVSNAPYTIRGVLTLSSSKFKFPDGATRPLLLAHPTNSVRVPVAARTLGDSPVTVSFIAPGGGLVFAHGQVTVRSTATSVVGVVLTAAALAILLGWWARTWWTGRRRRRTAAEAGQSA